MRLVIKTQNHYNKKSHRKPGEKKKKSVCQNTNNDRHKRSKNETKNTHTTQ